MNRTATEWTVGVIVFAALVAFICMLVIARRERGMSESEVNQRKLERKTRLRRIEVSKEYPYPSETVWSLIRPADLAVKLGDSANAFTVPGTPNGVGERQCFVAKDGTETFLEVLEERDGEYARVCPYPPGANAYCESTYELNRTPKGCKLVLGHEQLLPFAIPRKLQRLWEEDRQQFLLRVAQLLDSQVTQDGTPRN